ncbi:MAG TPA: hypothetical protein VF469_37305 [Kofleriaceae bacterium]
MKTSKPSLRDQPSRFLRLTVKDLLEAREAYHNHLMGIGDNVVGTAIGLFRQTSEPERTFANSRIIHEAGPGEEVSWPCVLVFVDRWRPRSEFATAEDFFERYVPPYLYLSDGRVVPTCVVKLTRHERAPDADLGHFANPVLSGGYPIATNEQGRAHLGTLGCLVTDGATTYGLTCRHVVGEPGREVFNPAHPGLRIGVSDRVQEGKQRFSQVYADWPGHDVVLDVDAGLVRFDDLSQVTAQIIGVKRLGPVWNVSPENLSLDWIGREVVSFRAGPRGRTRQSTGEIGAYFYRFKAVGGVEYVADVLLSPKPGALDEMHSVPGDSGRLWFVADEHVMRPIAMQWGGYQLAGAGQVWQFALGTFLSTICRELDVDLVSSWNAGNYEYWSAAVHRTISSLLPRIVKTPALQQLLELNAANLEWTADKPDCWVYANRFQREAASSEAPFHYTDMDLPTQTPEFAGRSLVEIWRDQALVTKDVLKRYLDGITMPGGKPKPVSSLPFRAAYVWKSAVEFLQAGDVERFVAAIGVLAHYIEDASCALHGSFNYDGDTTAPDYNRLKGIHHKYDDIVDKAQGDVADELLGRLDDFVPDHGAIQTPGDMARAAAALQCATFDILAPEELFQIYRDHDYKLRWADVAERAERSIVGSLKLMAQAIESAWAQGGGAAVEPFEVKRGRLEELCLDESFLPSTADYDPADEVSATPAVAEAADRHARPRTGRQKRVTRPRPRV